MIYDCDVLVIGGGAAAARAAIEAAGTGDTRVILMDKGRFMRSGTSPLGLHGLITTLHPKDSVDTLVADFIRNGREISDYDLLWTAAEESHKEPALLEAMGMHFVRMADGTYEFYRGAGHTVPHGIVIDEDLNAVNPVVILGIEAWKRGVKLVEGVMLTDLLVEDGQVHGAFGIDEKGDPVIVAAGAVVLAAGGANRVFPNVVPRIANETYRTTGDALVLALRAGLDLVDMEFANFRDTPPAVRLAGRYVNSKGEPFMSKYDPMLENAPRGKIVEALYLEMQAGNEPITIEMTPESERTVSFLTQEYKDYFKAAREGKPPRVTISFQRLLGGVRFKPDASTDLLGLYTAGESAGGFHGGDRLQSGAFLETQVFGRLAGQNAAAFAGTGARGVARAERLSLPLRLLVRDRLPHPDGTPARKVIETVQKIAWDHASILKDNAGLELALAKLADVRAQSHRRLSAAYLFEPFEAENLALVAEAIVRAAGQREETRATHRRRDFPNENPALARVHTRVRLLDGRLAADRVPAREVPRHAMT